MAAEPRPRRGGRRAGAGRPKMERSTKRALNLDQGTMDLIAKHRGGSSGAAFIRRSIAELVRGDGRRAAAAPPPATTGASRTFPLTAPGALLAAADKLVAKGIYSGLSELVRAAVSAAAKEMG